MMRLTRTRSQGDRVPRAGEGSLAPGVVGGFVASLCCLPPSIAIVLGLGVGGSTALATLGAHEGEILLGGLGLTLAVSWWTLRRQAKACRIDRSPVPFFLQVIGVFAAVYLVTLTVAHVITPLVANGSTSP